MAQGFRKDVQGLRALAVLAVTLFHFDVEVAGFTLSGGFCGVDVFYVISGFVIGTRILEDLAQGEFSLAAFYRRRARRILPALLVTVLLSAGCAWFVLLPPDYLEFGRSLLALLLSLANVYFWKVSGYFAPESQTMPLLHGWSLAVEEQFYLIMPLVMLAFYRLFGGRGWLWLVLPVLLGSLALGVMLAFMAPRAGFYLLPGRVWQLQIGLLVAVLARRGGANGVLPPGFWREAGAALGLALVLGGMVWLSTERPYPAWYALIPCVGAGLVIAAGCGASNNANRGPMPAPITGALNHLLGLAPVQMLGAISYSLYLVHWPMAALFQYGLMRKPEGAEPWVMLGFSVALAYVLWRWVELPFLKPARRLRAPTRWLLAGGMLGALGVGAGLVLSQGVPSRFPDYASPPIAGQEIWGIAPCFHEDLAKPLVWNAKACVRVHADATGALGAGNRRILLWGDSFAAHYVPGLIADGGRLQVDVLQYTFAGCPPILAFDSLSRPGCAPSNAAVPAFVQEQHIAQVVLAARWSDVPAHTRARLPETLARLRSLGVAVVVIGQSPQFASDVRRLDYVSGQSRRAIGMLPVSFDRAINAQLAAAVAKVAGVVFVDPMPALCPGASCLYRQGANWLYADYGHFSKAGSLRAVRAYFPAQ